MSRTMEQLLVLKFGEANNKFREMNHQFDNTRQDQQQISNQFDKTLLKLETANEEIKEDIGMGK